MDKVSQCNTGERYCLSRKRVVTRVIDRNEGFPEKPEALTITPFGRELVALLLGSVTFCVKTKSKTSLYEL
jgi:hypothetical protein